MSDFLTTRQLADRYAIPPCDALQSFDNLLRRWRVLDDGGGSGLDEGGVEADGGER